MPDSGKAPDDIVEQLLTGEPLALQDPYALYDELRATSLVFQRAAELDLGREDVTHLGFAQGMHMCLGAMLGRLESMIALETKLVDGLAA
jgi:hypothetical protein